MFNALASLAQTRARRVVIIAVVFFAVAGAMGAGVADRLDRYGADDPSTESVMADERLESAGFRDASVIVLIEDAPPAQPAGRQRIEEVERKVRTDFEIAEVVGFLETGNPDFVSADGTSTYLAVSVMPTDDKELQEAGQRIADDLDEEPGVSVGGFAVASEQVNKQVEDDLRTAELLVFPVLFLLTFLFFRSGVAALLPLMIGGLAIVGTFLLLRVGSEFGSVSIFALNLTT